MCRAVRCAHAEPGAGRTLEGWVREDSLRGIDSPSADGRTASPEESSERACEGRRLAGTEQMTAFTLSGATGGVGNHGAIFRAHGPRPLIKSGDAELGITHHGQISLDSDAADDERGPRKWHRCTQHSGAMRPACTPPLPASPTATSVTKGCTRACGCAARVPIITARMLACRLVEAAFERPLRVAASAARRRGVTRGARHVRFPAFPLRAPHLPGGPSICEEHKVASASD